MAKVCVPIGDELGAYGFPHGHPFGPGRLEAFWQAMVEQGLDRAVVRSTPVQAARKALLRFHTEAYVDRVAALSKRGSGLLDSGDTPAFPGCFEAAAFVVGSALDALDQILNGSVDRAFIPIAGLHHARRDRAGGFCIFNDCGVLIETLRLEHGIRRILYVDIDAHHGDGVYYEFESDPEVFIVDVHEDGRALYPGTGAATERGVGAASGTKLNLPVPPGADDGVFDHAWATAETFLTRARPEFVLLQCGADSVAGDPLTHLCFSPRVHERTTAALVRLSRAHCHGRVLAMGGGGYSLGNLATAWTAVIRQLLAEDETPAKATEG
jgi:acetoin utilization protein AcuC